MVMMTVMVMKMMTTTGNLLRAGDKRGYNSMAKMYTFEYAKVPIPGMP
jgi:hypothetical protein